MMKRHFTALGQVFLMVVMMALMSSCSRVANLNVLNSDDICFVEHNVSPVIVVYFADNIGHTEYVADAYGKDVFTMKGMTFNRRSVISNKVPSFTQDSEQIVVNGSKLIYGNNVVFDRLEKFDFAVKTPKYIYWGGIVKPDGGMYGFYCIGRFCLSSSKSTVVRVAAKVIHNNWDIYVMPLAVKK